ncbi:type III-B CRISPR module RAMP protein Cmr1 [Dehalobacterium formicoaceticum]|uniref:Type III-B CRISPR module RAMP protein Cmr1 n=1 Tax=Dehalobacterium formicoaceticum TaxID=51515 RepID=A0ABT1Y1I7_9FIRM|nr:type III-B CRISPR module RAMP protein Cmr1 [Dehalobacterium formicoaceticum]MCR6544723.1 type III-B CRISPR module RAMP protein Cmr1 [Dehalobacterium formicoaceticum]
MEKLSFECELISPLFQYGADQNNPEFRAPSMKGVLRYWWRAAQAEANISALRSLEGRIFGGTNTKADLNGKAEGEKSTKQEGRSCFAIRMTHKKVDIRKEAMLPHKKEYKAKANANAIVMYTNFGVEFSFIRMPDEFSPAHLQTLFELTSLLGGMGGRSRRGFGSFRILRCNNLKSEIAELKQEDILPQILSRLNFLSKNKFTLKNEMIQLENNKNASYPYIETIALGKPEQDFRPLLRKISNISHENNSDYTGYGSYGERKRLSSPEYVSIIKGEQGKVWPINTSLHLALEPGFTLRRNDTRKAFREAILS